MLLPDDDKKPAVDTYRFYDADGKELTDWTQTVAKGEELLEPTAPTKDNARFVGWYDESGNLFEGFGEITSVTGGATVKLTTKFEDVRYVYFMNKDGSSVCYTAEGKAETAVSSSDLEAAENKVNLMLDAESHVVGWSTVPNDDETTTVTFAKDEIVTMVYPVIERGFWVKFDTDGGSHVQSVFCEPGKTLTLSQVPTRSGYTFDGWYDADGNSVTTVSETATVTAHWTASNNTKYTVIHWLENADDDEYTLDGTETKTGTTGSETNAAAKSYTGFTADPITQETIAGDGSTIVNVYYKRVVYEVKFMGLTCNKEEHTHGVDCWGWCHKKEHTHNENCYTEITGLIIRAKHGANISKNWPTYQGSTWAVNPTGGPYQVNIDTMPMGGDTFYGPKTGQGSETAYYYVEALPGASNTVTVDGIKYVLHHSDTSPGTGYHITDEDKYPITGFKFETFNAKWGRDGYNYNNAKFYYTRNSYDITFINNGSTDDTKNFKYEASIADAYYVPNHPSEIDASYTFAGWYDNKLCEGEPFVFTGKTMPATGITLYAKWQAPQVNATVYLSASADSESKTFSVPYGKKITESDDFNAIIAHIKAETGEAPSAWFVVTGEGRVLFDLDTPLYSSVTLYPFFASSSEGYTVTYKEEGTDEPAKDGQKYLTGSRAGILAPVNGENFRAWKMEDGKLIHPGDKITVTKNITLTAVYTKKPQTVTITYHYNFTDKDGSYKDDIFEDDNHPKNTNAIVKSLGDVGFKAPIGYEFRGWATARDSSTIEYAAGATVFVDANGDNDLYAVWQVKTYTVTWVDEDGTTLIDQKDYEYGAIPKFEGVEPTKAADAQYTYTFKGWDKDYTEVKGNQTYVAVYEKTTNKYTVKWVDEDGTTLIDQKDYEYGAIPKFEGVEPTKAADAQYTYTFKGWDKDYTVKRQPDLRSSV